ncbi:MAG: hypothetical protein R3E96_07730 [Planctomycetota bacterium]
MIAAFLPFLLLPTAPVVVAQESLPAEELVRLLYLDDRDPQAKFEQVLALLEARPEHPLALDWIEVVRDLPPGIEAEALVHRLLGLRSRVTDARVHTVLGHWLRHLEEESSLGGMPLDLGEDLFPDWLRRFYMVGPVGALTDPVPLSSPLPAENDPEQVLKTSYTTGWGETVAWEPRERSRRRNSVPGFNQPYHSGGCVYLLAGVDLAEGDGWLELETSDAVRVLWNSQVVYERLSTGLSNSGDWLRIPLHFRAGVNTLLLVTDGSQWIDIGARLLDKDGKALPPRAVDLDGILSAPRDGQPALRGKVAQEPHTPLGQGPYERVLADHRRLGLGRADQVVIATSPELPGARLAHQRLRYRALQEQSYLPEEIARQRSIELEQELLAGDGLGLMVSLNRARRLLAEDKVAEAQAEVQALRNAGQRHPQLDRLAIDVAGALDAYGILARGELQGACERWPDNAGFHAQLAARLERDGNVAGAYDHALRALRLGAGDESVLDMVLKGIAIRRDDATRAWLLAALERAVQLDANNWSAEYTLQHALVTLGEGTLAIERARVHAEAHPADLQVWVRLMGLCAEQGLHFGDAVFDRAFAQVERLEPALAELREWKRVEGQGVRADSFFQAFGPDEAAAWQVAGGMEQASTLEVLDSGLVFLYPDGSRVGRVHTVTKAVDRSGTEELHELQAQGEPLLARVRKADGSTREPALVQGSWVMPSLDPGDAVELKYEWQAGGEWGGPVDLGLWRFASLERPFALSRYVVYVPSGLNVELRTRNFAGRHVTEPWGDGVVHILSSENNKRLEQEPLMPSEVEILPCAQFGADGSPLEEVQQFHRFLGDQMDLPAELDADLTRWLGEMNLTGDPVQKAGAIYQQLVGYLVEFDGSLRTSDVWFARRGQPILLFGALLERAGVPTEWALLRTNMSPEINPDPKPMFADQDGYGQLVLRIGGPDAPATWQVAPASKGLPFAKLPDHLAGVEALVLGKDGERRETLPRDMLDSTWDLELHLTWTIDAQDQAQVEGEIAVSTAEGSQIRQQLMQVSGTQRDGFVRGIVPRMVPGIDLQSSELVDLDVPGAPFRLRFTGTRPDFMQESGNTLRAELRIPADALSTGLGPSQRNWPLAARLSKRMRAQIVVRFGDGLKVVGGPGAFDERRPGFQHTVAVESQPGEWTLERTMILRGMYLEPSQVPSFMEREAELEREESRPLEFQRAGAVPAEPEPETVPAAPEQE